LPKTKKTHHDYFVEETLQVGMVLVGTEVKSVRMGKVNLKDSHVGVRGGEMFVYGMHISPYEKGNIFIVLGNDFFPFVHMLAPYSFLIISSSMRRASG